MKVTLVFCFAYYFGIASCGIQGSEKTKNICRYRLIHRLICSLLNSFGGGFIRDAVVLHAPPWFFTADSIPDIRIALFSGLCYVYFSIKYNDTRSRSIQFFINFTDAIGLGTFICIGSEKAFSMHSPLTIVCLSGIVTSIGGGMLANMFFCHSIIDVLSDSIPYRLAVLTNTLMYIHWRYEGADSTSSQFLLIITTTISALLSDSKTRTIIAYKILSYEDLNDIVIMKNYYILLIMVTIINTIMLSVPTFVNLANRAMRTKKLNVLYHRILQM